MDIKKMAELIRAKVHEVEEAGIFDELAEAAVEKEKLETHNAGASEEDGSAERSRY